MVTRVVGGRELTRDVQSYRKLLDEALVQNFPELGEHLMASSLETAMQGVKKEEDTSNGITNGV